MASSSSLAPATDAAITVAPSTSATTPTAPEVTSAHGGGQRDEQDDSSPTRKQPIEYMTVKEILEKFHARVVLQKINVYGVITYLPSPDRRESKCTQVTIVDQTCCGNDKLKLNVFTVPGEPHIRDSCEIGDIIRFHRINVQEYNGRAQGVHVSKMSSWVRFKRTIPARSQKTTNDDASAMDVDVHPSLSGEFDFIGNKSNNTIEERDRKMITELRKWLETNPATESLIEAGLSSISSDMNIATANGGGLSVQSIGTDFEAQVNRFGNSNLSPTRHRLASLSDINNEGFFDVVCQVCGIGEHKGARFLIIWDGTKSSQSFYQESQFELVKEGGLYSPDLLSYVYQVFVFDEFMIASNGLRPGDFIFLKNMNVKYARINSQLDMIMKMPGQSIQGLKYGRKIQTLAAPSEIDAQANSENEIENRTRSIWRKGKELNVNIVNSVEFIREFTKITADEDVNITLNELIQKNNSNANNNKPGHITAVTHKLPSILSQVNQLLADDENAYKNSQQPTTSTTTPTTELIRKSPKADAIHRKSIREVVAAKTSDVVDDNICDEIWRLNRLVKMTHLVPFITQTKLKDLTTIRCKFEPYFASLSDMVEEATKHPYMRCKVTAKMLRHAMKTAPVISNVYVCCKHCGYVNFVPFHLANIYQTPTLNMILRSQIVTDEPSTQLATQETQQNDPTKLTRNFSLEWLKTAMPMESIELAPTQCDQKEQSETTQTYEYACPRCDAQCEDEPPRALSFIYRIWIVLRDFKSELTPCLLEDEMAATFLAPVDPIKCFSNSAKSHEVYKRIQKAFDHKYLFTMETFRIDQVTATVTAASASNIATSSSTAHDLSVKVLFKIIDMVEVVG